MIVTSAWTAAELARRQLADPDRTVVAVPGTLPAEPGPPPTRDGELLCIGVIAPHKGQDTLLSALGRLRSEDWRCTIVGSTDAFPEFAAGIARQVISLTAPGVQVLAPGQAVAMATVANDRLAEACRRYPDRFTGLTAVAPQDPSAAAREIERGVSLGFKGVIINSHTHGEYLDDQKFWPILEAAEALDSPIYLHPTTPPRTMIQPLLEAGLDGAIYGFAVETGMHLLRLITAGVFDRFPRLRVVLGHLGEALPFWLYRLDFMHAATVRSGRYDAVRPIVGKPSDYLRRNVWVTTSGMAWHPAIMFCRDVLSHDRVLYAMDYPYQYVIDEVSIQDDLPIDDAAKKAFFQTNAEQLFGL